MEKDIETTGVIGIVCGLYGDCRTPIMESHMEHRIEHEMETGGI